MKKSNVFRAIFLAFFIIGIVSLSIILIQESSDTPATRSLLPLFQELGKPVQSINRSISQLLPVYEIDEKILGEEIRSNFFEHFVMGKGNEEQEYLNSVNYLNSLVSSLTKDSKKSFDYQVFLIEGGLNAFSMPGGTICITKNLLKTLKNEAELVAILSHEIGHIERGHLFDAVRDELLNKKAPQISLVSYVAVIIQVMSKISFSKTQEDEADEYGFRTLIKFGYDPAAMSSCFQALLQEGSSNLQVVTNPIKDFFSTHPYIKFRIEKFSSRAKLWKENSPNQEYYLGESNLIKQVTAFEKKFPEKGLEVPSN